MSHGVNSVTRSGVDMSGERGGWQRHGARVLYASRWVRLRLLDLTRPDGVREEYHVVEFAPVAVAVVINDRDEVLMLWRWREPVRRWGYELPGGLVEAGETAAAAAARETREETAWQVRGAPQPLPGFEPLPGQLAAQASAFLWRSAEYVDGPVDAEEGGAVRWVPLADVPRLAAEEKLAGSPALVPLLFLLTTRS